MHTNIANKELQRMSKIERVAGREGLVVKGWDIDMIKILFTRDLLKLLLKISFDKVRS